MERLEFLSRSFYICFHFISVKSAISYFSKVSLFFNHTTRWAEAFWETAFGERPTVSYLILLARVPEWAGLEAFSVVERCQSVICIHWNWARGFSLSFNLYFHREQLVKGHKFRVSRDLSAGVFNGILIHLGSSFCGIIIIIMHTLGEREYLWF